MIENECHKPWDIILIKTYHTLQQWAHWLTHSLGIRVLECERKLLSSLLKERYGKHALLIGVSEQHVLLKDSVISQQVVLSPLVHKNKKLKYIESEFNELPIIPGSIDVVVLPHTLEFIDNPRQLLMEACRVVKPEGDIMICCFNPLSLWGLKKWWFNHKNIPWSGNFIRAKTIKNWLKLADFELTRQDMLMYGGIFVITAKAKVIPLSPIKLRWKQSLPTFSVQIPGSSMRDLP